MDQQDTPDVPEDSKISTEDGRQYWENIDADVNGMLGGFPYISKVDLVGSRAFLAKLGFGRKAGLKTVERALEGGAGLVTSFFPDASSCAFDKPSFPPTFDF